MSEDRLRELMAPDADLMSRDDIRGSLVLLGLLVASVGTAMLVAYLRWG